MAGGALVRGERRRGSLGISGHQRSQTGAEVGQWRVQGIARREDHPVVARGDEIARREGDLGPQVVDRLARALLVEALGPGGEASDLGGHVVATPG